MTGQANAPPTWASPLTAVWGVGDPAQVIVDTAREHGASRIIVGAHHHGFLGRLFGEDVDAEVQRAADCEVVLVP